MQKDAFKPAPGGREISVVGGNGPLMGQQGVMPRRMVPMPQQGAAPPVPLPMDPATWGAAISSKREVPRGATEVHIAGTNPQASASPPMPSASAPVQLPAQGGLPVVQVAQPRPFLQRPMPKVSDVFRVSLSGTAPDGSTWSAHYDAEFPIGIQVTDLHYQPLS